MLDLNGTFSDLRLEDKKFQIATKWPLFVGADHRIATSFRMIC